MTVFSFIAIFLLIRRLKKSLTFSPSRAKWFPLFTAASWITIGGYVLLAICHFNGGFNSILGGALLLGAIVFGEKEPDFKQLDSFIKAHYPLAAAELLTGLVELIVPKFYARYDNYFVFAVIGGFIWIFARWATTKKQQQEFNLITQQNLALDKMVAERTAELTQQKNELQETLVLLQTTQQQLIQSEKLASLGELTAGIAHEIQNPLNFVNNFSEVNTELLDEMQQEIDKGNFAEVKAIAGDIKENQQKINQHGKRADAIVKGTLQHSKAGGGTREATNINALADEYMRLAYHGLRAKDKSFNAEMVTRFDEGLPMINVVQQDIGRVMLNLFNNAFYAVHLKQQTAGIDYKPTIEVSTKLISPPSGGRGAEIHVRDNGNGIPEAIKDKIMQPFFTTKPTGEGTGLGLSLSYDMVVKGHGGSIAVNTKEGEFTEIVVSLPSAPSKSPPEGETFL